MIFFLFVLTLGFLYEWLKGALDWNQKIDAINYDQMEKHISKNGFLITKVNDLINWARSGSLWPMSFGWHVAVEMMQSFANNMTSTIWCCI